MRRAFEYVFAYNKHARLEIIGDGLLRADIEQWIKEHDLQGAITLHGWQNNVKPIMQTWHAFALTSLWEGLPCALVEAKMMGLPVICYDTGGIKDIIKHGQHGLLYQKKDWQSFAQGMLTLSTQEPLFNQLRSTQNLDEFHHNVMLQRHAELYKKIHNSFALNK